MSEGKSNGTGWYNTGYDGMAAEEARVASQFQPPRFWMPKGHSKEIVFNDDDPFNIHEHNPQIGGNWRNWMTCLKGAGEDPVCCEIMGLKSRYWVGYYTVIDCSSWEDQQGNKYQYEIMLFPARMGTLLSSLFAVVAMVLATIGLTVVTVPRCRARNRAMKAMAEKTLRLFGQTEVSADQLYATFTDAYF